MLSFARRESAEPAISFLIGGGRGSRCALSFSADLAEVVIGRAPSCHVVVPGRDVSRRHAVITMRGHQPLLEDLSVNGTYVNGVRVFQAYTSLPHRSLLVVGLFWIKVNFPANEDVCR